MKFEKWTALGNDYLIVEAAALPWEPTPERIRRICDPHFGVGSDGLLLLAPVEDPGYVAELRIFNPDGSEAELSGNGAREAVLYLRRSGWTDADSFTILTKAGPITPTIRSDREATLEMGRASTTSDDYPSGAEDGQGRGRGSGPVLAVSARLDREPAVRDRDRRGARIARSGGDRSRDRDQPAVPEPHQRELLPREGDRVRARIFERGVGETLASGTGASGAAIAAHLAGAPSRLTVELDGGELEVEIGKDLSVRLTGWAEPIFSGELSAELLRALEELG